MSDTDHILYFILMVAITYACVLGTVSFVACLARVGRAWMARRLRGRRL